MPLFVAGCVHDLERHQRPPVWVHTRQLEAEVLRKAPVLDSVRSPSVRAGLSAAVVPLQALRGGGLAEWPAPHRFAVRLRRLADLCAPGAVRALRRELDQAREQAPAHQVQPSGDVNWVHKCSLLWAHIR